MNDAHFYSLTMDGSTDEGCIEQETLFVRICHHGKLEAKFLSIGEPELTTSQNLHKYVIDQIESHKLQFCKLIGFGCDGATNMVCQCNTLIN